MKIYTKTGDDGTTSLYGGKRISKDDIRIESYGTVDELNSFIGLLSAQISMQESVARLIEIQKTLFNIGSQLANDPDKPLHVPTVTEEDIKVLETDIDTMNLELEPLKTFILPGGSMAIGTAHVCRTICRRAERRVIHLSKEGPIPDHIVQYLNRLSDYFFVLSRYIAYKTDTEELKWLP